MQATDINDVAQSLRDTTSLHPDRVATHITVSAVSKVAVDHGTFNALLVANGCDFRPLGDPAPPHSVLRKAVGRARKGSSSLWEPIGTDAGVLSYALVMASTDAHAKEWDGRQVCALYVDESGAPPLVEWATGYTPTEAAKGEAQRVLSRFTELQGVHTSESVQRFIRESALSGDIRDRTRKVVAQGCQGVRIGRTGTYLVPKGEDVRFLRATEALTYASFEVVANEVFDRAAGRYSGSVNRGLADEVADIVKEVEKLKTDGRSTKLDTLHGKFDQIETIRQKATLYRSIVGDIDALVSQY